MFCDKCGTKLPEGSAFCNHCGNKIEMPPAPQPVQQPVQPAPAPVAPQPVAPVQQTPQTSLDPVAAPKKKKSSGGKAALWVVIGVLVVIVALLAGMLLGGGTLGKTDEDEDDEDDRNSSKSEYDDKESEIQNEDTVPSMTGTEEATAMISDATPTEPDVDENLDKALEYLRAYYIDEDEKTPTDYLRIGKVQIAGIPYEVVWTVDLPEDVIKVIVNENGLVSIDLNEDYIANSTYPTPYTLIATLTGTDGRQVSLTWNCRMPAAIDEDARVVVDAAYNLKKGEALDGIYTLTGKIVSIDTMYNENYKNITVTIEIPGRETRPIKCYRLQGEGIDKLCVGDTITVAGVLRNYNGTIEFDFGCTLENIVS